MRTHGAYGSLGRPTWESPRSPPWRVPVRPRRRIGTRRRSCHGRAPDDRCSGYGSSVRRQTRTPWWSRHSRAKAKYRVRPSSPVAVFEPPLRPSAAGGSNLVPIAGTASRTLPVTDRVHAPCQRPANRFRLRGVRAPGRQLRSHSLTAMHAHDTLRMGALPHPWDHNIRSRSCPRQTCYVTTAGPSQPFC